MKAPGNPSKGHLDWCISANTGDKHNRAVDDDISRDHPSPKTAIIKFQASHAPQAFSSTSPKMNAGLPLLAELRLEVYKWLIIPQTTELTMDYVRLVSHEFQAEYDHELLMEIRKHREAVLADHSLFELSGPEPNTYMEARKWKFRQRSSPALTSEELKKALHLLADKLKRVLGLAPCHVLWLEVALLSDIGVLETPWFCIHSDNGSPSGRVCYKFRYQRRLFSIILREKLPGYD